MKHKPPALMFSEELLGVFVRWSEESELDPLDMAEAAVAVINNFCNEPVMDFEPDAEFMEELDDVEVEPEE